MRFNRYVLAQLSTPPGYEALAKDDSRRLLDAHLAYVADLHEAGVLLAHGHASGDDRHTRSFAIMTCDFATARQVWADDPAVQAHRYAVELDEWLVPEGMIVDGPGLPPRSVAESNGAH